MGAILSKRELISRQTMLRSWPFDCRLTLEPSWQCTWMGARRRFGGGRSKRSLILPSFLMAIVVAAALRLHGQLSWIQGNVLRHRRAAYDRDHRSKRFSARAQDAGQRSVPLACFASVAITTVWTGSEIVWLFVLCGVISVVVKAAPAFLSEAGCPLDRRRFRLAAHRHARDCVDGSLMEPVFLLLEGRSVCVWQRIGDRAILYAGL